jgi:hypothetical protein
MTEYKYILEKGSKKHPCPNCGNKSFVRFTDTGTGEYLPDKYGRCDREINCSYFLSPLNNGYVREHAEVNVMRPVTRTKPKPIFIPFEVLKDTRKNYEQNIFIQNLLNNVPFPFEVKEIEKVISLYNLGTVRKGYRSGAVTFPFMDKNGNVRAIQIKQFDKTNHTVKNGTDFLHSIIEKYHKEKCSSLPEWLSAYLKNDLKVSCLFGEHNLNKYPLNPIALVEAPKTAIYGTLYFGFPEHNENLLWLAVFNLSSLTVEKCKSLKGRDVYLFPDLSKDGKAFDLWNKKAKEFSDLMPDTQFKVSDLLEIHATETDRSKGLDLADFLIKQDWRKFRPQQIEAIEEAEQPKPEPLLISKSEASEQSDLSNQNCFLTTVHLLPAIKDNDLIEPVYSFSKAEEPKQYWDEKIYELKKYFSEITLPAQPIRLNQCSTITDIPKFIENHFSVVKGNNGKRSFKPYLERLNQLKSILQNISLFWYL